jgi:hypothetical protein
LIGCGVDATPDWRTPVRSRDPWLMLSSHEVESLRRSNAMAPLTQSHIAELLDDLAQVATERAAIVAVFADLPNSFAAVRTALNTLQRIVK